MTNSVIVTQSGAIEKDGIVHIPINWYYILHPFGNLLKGSVLICRKDRSLKTKMTMPAPRDLKPILLDNLDGMSIISRIKGYMMARKTIRLYIERAAFVVSFLPSHLGDMAADIAINHKKPVLVEVLGETKLYDKRISLRLPFRYLAYRRAKKLQSKVIRNADFVIYVSQNLVEVLPEKPKGYAVIPETTIYDRDLYEREDTCMSSPIRIFSANRIVKQKGLQNLLLAIKQLRNETFDVVATLSGDGEYLPELKQQCSELGLNPYVTFPGYISVEELWQLYRQSDIMVLPTLASGEGTPRCIIEAMASCCPIVASAVGGIPMIFQEAQSGTGVTMGNVDELVDAIRQIITDDNLRRRYILNGLLWASELTLEKRNAKINAVVARTFPQYEDLAYD